MSDGGTQLPRAARHYARSQVTARRWQQVHRGVWCDQTIDDRRLWLDVCFPDLRIAIEIDGKAYHLFSEDWEDDLDRQNDLVLDGWLVLRFSARAIRQHPDQVVRRVAMAIAEGQRRVPADRSAGAA